MDSKFFLSYLAPDAEVVTVAVEHGFDGSSNFEDPKEDEPQGWFFRW